MDKQSHENDLPARPGDDEIRPVGTWLICGLVLFASLAIWSLVAIIFAQRA